MTWRDDRPQAKRGHPETFETKQMSKQIRYKNKLLIYTAAQCGRCHKPSTPFWKSPISRGGCCPPRLGGLCSHHSPQGRARQALLAHSHPKGSSTHLNGSISAELVHAQEGQADTLCDTSSSHCCCSLQDTEQTTVKICMCVCSLTLKTYFALDICPLHCHHPFRELSSTHTSTLLKIQYQEKQHCSSRKI